jgi:hypothetical protein
VRDDKGSGWSSAREAGDGLIQPVKLSGFGAAMSKGLEPQLAAAGLTSGAAFAKAFAPVALAAALIGTGVAVTKMAADYQSATTLLVTGAGESEAAT